MRVTRAALRAASATDFHHDEDSCTASTVNDNYAPMDEVTGSRPALSEVTGNNTSTLAAVFATEHHDLKAPTTMAPLKKGKSGKNNKLQITAPVRERKVSGPEFLEDDLQSDHSSAAEAATEELMKFVKGEEVLQVPMDPDRPKTPLSAATREGGRQLSRSAVSSATARFDPDMYRAEGKGGDAEQEQKEDSFVGSIHSRTPAKRVGKAAAEADTSPNEGSFADKIVSRTPSKPVARIEDSVEAMDALEEALEQVAQGLPAVGENGITSPVQKKHINPNSKQPNAGQPSTLQARQSKPSSVTAARHKTAPVSKPIDRNPGPAAAKRANPRPVSSVVTKKEYVAIEDSMGAAAQSKPGLSFHSSSVKVAKKPRPSSISLSTNKPGFVPAKSSKPPTRATFTLPGEAIEAKKKAQREAKLKREAEAEAEKRKFKARPVRSSIPAITPAPRPTAASKARESLMTIEKSKENRATNPAERKRSAVVAIRTLNSKAGSPRPKRQSTVLSVAKRPGTSGNSSAPKANTSVVRAASMIAHSGQRTSSVDSKNGYIPASTQTQITKAEAAMQKARAKEIFGRDKAVMAEMEKAKREKEEAAKRARAEAAERGRVASREWAEKQKAKKLASMSAERVPSDEAMSAVAQ